MQNASFVVAVGAYLAFASAARGLGAVASSIGLVVLGILVAIAVVHEASSWGVASGALGALVGGVVSDSSPALAGACMMLAAFSLRTTRVRAPSARRVHLALACGSGAIAGALSASFVGAAPPVYLAAIVVSAVLAAAPFLVVADDAVAHALAVAARAVEGPSSELLRKAAVLRRRAGGVQLDADARERLTTTWTSLVRLASVRARLAEARLTHLDALRSCEVAPLAVDAGTTTESVTTLIDERISEHIRVLARAYAAVDTALAASLGLDDLAAKSVDAMNESLDDLTRALVEVRKDPCS